MYDPSLVAVGPIPSSIGKLRELRHLNLGGNRLDGHMPLLPRGVRLLNVRCVCV